MCINETTSIPAPPLYTLAYHGYYGAGEASSSPSLGGAPLSTPSKPTPIAQRSFSSPGCVLRSSTGDAAAQIGAQESMRRRHSVHHQPAEEPNDGWTCDEAGGASSAVAEDVPHTPSSSILKVIASKLFPIVSPRRKEPLCQQEEVEYEDGFVGACSALGSPVPAPKGHVTVTPSPTLETSYAQYYQDRSDDRGTWTPPGLEESDYTVEEVGEEPDVPENLMQFYSPNAARLVKTLQTTGPKESNGYGRSKSACYATNVVVTPRKGTCKQQKSPKKKCYSDYSRSKSASHVTSASLHSLVDETKKEMSAQEFFMSTEDFFNSPQTERRKGASQLVDVSLGSQTAGGIRQDTGETRCRRASNDRKASELAESIHRNDLEMEGPNHCARASAPSSHGTNGVDNADSSALGAPKPAGGTVAAIGGAVTSFLRFYGELILLGMHVPKSLVFGTKKAHH